MGWASAPDYDNQPLSEDHELNEHERTQALLFLRGQVLEARDESSKSEKRVKNDVTGGAELVEECPVNPAPPARLRREGRRYVSTGAKCHEANGQTNPQPPFVLRAHLPVPVLRLSAPEFHVEAQREVNVNFAGFLGFSTDGLVLLIYLIFNCIFGLKGLWLVLNIPPNPARVQKMQWNCVAASR